MNKTILADKLRRFVGQHQEKHSTKTKWRTPLMGVAPVNDSLFLRLKSIVSPTHALPGDLLPTARTVVAFFIPFHESIAQSNIEGQLASKEWALAYIETNALLKATGLYMKQCIESQGHAVAVTPPTHNFHPRMLISEWSHRHIAYVAGLGRFGLNNMLITEYGCCGRLGSVITSLELPADHRSDNESCLYRHNGSCKRCVERCVGNALFPDRFYRHNCYEVCLQNEKKYEAIGKADICGKCLVNVPCAFIKPVKTKAE